jgi:hypothetical protein
MSHITRWGGGRGPGGGRGKRRSKKYHISYLVSITNEKHELIDHFVFCLYNAYQ